MEIKFSFKTVCNLAIPVALQSMLQSSFSIVDQIMIGQLGSVSVAGVGLAGKFSSIFSVMVSAVSAVAGNHDRSVYRAEKTVRHSQKFFSQSGSCCDTGCTIHRHLRRISVTGYEFIQHRRTDCPRRFRLSRHSGRNFPAVSRRFSAGCHVPLHGKSASSSCTQASRQPSSTLY